MTELHTRYDRRADVLYLFTDENSPAVACEDELGIVWRYVNGRHLVGATVIDFHELWADRLDELASALAKGFRLPAKRTEKVLAKAYA